MAVFLQALAAFITSMVAVGGFLFGVIKYLDKKRANSVKKQIQDAAQPIIEQNKAQSEQIAKLDKKVDRNEKDRLRTTIMEFADKLRNHFIVNKADFEHIHHMYDKYHDELHGNSYIEEEYNYIRAKEQEFYNNNDHKGRDK